MIDSLVFIYACETSVIGLMDRTADERLRGDSVSLSLDMGLLLWTDRKTR